MIFAFSLGDRVVNHFASLYGLLSMIVWGWRELAGTYDFALPREQDQVAGGRQHDTIYFFCDSGAYLMGILTVAEREVVE